MTQDNKNRNKIIAANIKSYIKENKITQKILAEAIGISPSTMSDYMNLRSNPSHGVIQKIADYFGIQKSDIDTTFKEDIEDDGILKIYNKLNDVNKKATYNFAKERLKEQETGKITDFYSTRRIETLAAHDPDEDRIITTEDVDNIHDVLDELDAEYDKKNNKDK